jgi:hypothetical protein
MEFFQSFWFWIALIAVAGIIGAAVTNAVDKSSKTKIRVAELQAGGDYKKVADDAAALNAEVVERLSALDARLASVEKTLTDIP